MNNIAIIGGGIAGLSLAILARKQGINVTLFEKYATFSGSGAGTTLWPNGTFILEQLCGLDKFIGQAGRPRLMCQYDRQGVQKNEFNIEELNTATGFPTLSILRRDLLHILSEQLNKLNITVHFNHNIHAREIPKLQEQFDLVVGCDGRLQSPVREILYKKTIAPQYQGFINIIGISKLKQTYSNQKIKEYRDSGERFGIVPVNNQFCYWAAAWPCSIDKKRTQKSWHHEMHQRFARWPDDIQKVLDCSEESSVKRIFVHDIDPLPYWHNKNLVMIGDAAHASLPTSGQGACQALEDAWHLSRLLSRHSTLDKMLGDFYTKRIHKTTSAQNIGRHVAQQIFHNKELTDNPLPEMSATQLSKLYMHGLE